MGKESDVHVKALNIPNREKQIKIIMGYYFTSVRMVSIKNIKDSKCWWGCIESEPYAFLVGM